MSIVRERRANVEIVRIDRPEARNAIDDVVTRGLEEAFDDIEADDDIRVAVLTGTGAVFSAGADLKLVAAGRSAEFHSERFGFAGFVERELTKPVIAAVNGPAIAGGFELALACDLIVASDTARFGLFEVKRGLIAAAGGLIRLPRRVPQNVAMEIAIAGTTLDATRAYELGLVSRVTPVTEVVDVAVEIATAIAEHAPLAVRRSRTLVKEAAYLSEADGWARTKEFRREVSAHPDSLEGARAFAEKRPPVWQST